MRSSLPVFVPFLFLSCFSRESKQLLEDYNKEVERNNQMILAREKDIQKMAEQLRNQERARDDLMTQVIAVSRCYYHVYNYNYLVATSISTLSVISYCVMQVLIERSQLPILSAAIAAARAKVNTHLATVATIYFSCK